MDTKDANADESVVSIEREHFQQKVAALKKNIKGLIDKRVEPPLVPSAVKDLGEFDTSIDLSLIEANNALDFFQRSIFQSNGNQIESELSSPTQSYDSVTDAPDSAPLDTSLEQFTNNSFESDTEPQHHMYSSALSIRAEQALEQEKYIDALDFDFDVGLSGGQLNRDEQYAFQHAEYQQYNGASSFRSGNILDDTMELVARAESIVAENSVAIARRWSELPPHTSPISNYSTIPLPFLSPYPPVDMQNLGDIQIDAIISLRRQQLRQLEEIQSQIKALVAEKTATIPTGQQQDDTNHGSNESLKESSQSLAFSPSKRTRNKSPARNLPMHSPRKSTPSRQRPGHESNSQQEHLRPQELRQIIRQTLASRKQKPHIPQQTGLAAKTVESTSTLAFVSSQPKSPLTNSMQEKDIVGTEQNKRAKSPRSAATGGQSSLFLSSLLDTLDPRSNDPAVIRERQKMYGRQIASIQKERRTPPKRRPNRSPAKPITRSKSPVREDLLMRNLDPMALKKDQAFSHFFVNPASGKLGASLQSGQSMVFASPMQRQATATIDSFMDNHKKRVRFQLEFDASRAIERSPLTPPRQENDSSKTSYFSPAAAADMDEIIEWNSPPHLQRFNEKQLGAGHQKGLQRTNKQLFASMRTAKSASSSATSLDDYLNAITRDDDDGAFGTSLDDSGRRLQSDFAEKPAKKKKHKHSAAKSQNKGIMIVDEDEDNTYLHSRRSMYDGDTDDSSRKRGKKRAVRHDSYLDEDEGESSHAASSRLKQPLSTTASGDLSPPRRKKRRAARHDSDLEDSDGDLSPPRRRSESSKPAAVDTSNKSHVSARVDEDGDLSPPRRRDEAASSAAASASQHQPKKLAGLKSAKEVKEHLDSIKQRQDKLFETMDPELSGRHAGTVFRDARTGKKVSSAEEYRKARKEEQDRRAKRKDRGDAASSSSSDSEDEGKSSKSRSSKKKREDEEETRIVRQTDLAWGTGLAQQKQAQDFRDRLLAEMDRPFYRYEDDPELEKQRKDELREGDPMAEYIMRERAKQRKGQHDEEQEEVDGNLALVTSAQRRKYEGPFPENRYNIRPGWRWDGVDRSNGFEQEIVQQDINRKSREAAAYKRSFIYEQKLGVELVGDQQTSLSF